MRKLFQSLLVGLACMGPLLIAGPVRAEEVLNPVCQANPEAIVCQENRKSQNPNSNSIYGRDGILTKIVNIISIVLGVAAVIVIIVGGFQYALSSGNPQSADKAKNTILYAIIGLIVAAAAQSIVIFILNKL